MRSEKLTLAFLPLAGCGGCEYAAFQAFVEYPELEEMYEIVYWPMVLDETEFPERVDVAIYEGVINTKGHLRNALELRRRAKIVISLGMCSSFSGIPGLSAYFNLKDILRDIYSGTTFKDHLEPLPMPISVPEVVPVDYIISHCPPIPSHIRLVLESIYKGEEPKVVERTVCSECPLKMKQRPPEEWKTKTSKALDPNYCFLSQGYLCLGPVSASGCGARCPRAGIPCYGCAGPTRDVLIREGEDIPVKMAKIIAAYQGKDSLRDYEEVLKKLFKVYDPRRFYMFTLNSVFFKNKPFSTAMRIIVEGRSGGRKAFRLNLRKRK